MIKSYKDWLKIILKKPLNIFWILFFPMILVTLFNLTMGKEGMVSSFSEKVKLAYIRIDDALMNSPIESALDSEELKKFYEINIYDNKDEAQKKVENKEIDGYFYIEKNEDNTYTFYAKTGYSSFANSMIKSLSENFVNSANGIYKAVIKFQDNSQEEIKQGDYTKSAEEIYKQEKTPAMSTLYTFPAIIFSILYTGLLVQFAIRSMSSNMSYTGMRVELGANKKSKIFIGAILATFTAGLIALMILTVYIECVLQMKVNLFSNFKYVISIYVVGLIVLTLLSAFVVLATSKRDEDSQINILNSILMTMYFLSGGMVGNMSLIIKKNVPFLYYINPATLLSDSLGYLSYKEDFSVIWRNLGIVSCIGVVFLILSIVTIRRKKNELF